MTIPTLFVFGSTGAGKSTCVRHILQPPFTAQVAIISMHVILTERQFYGKILSLFGCQDVACDQLTDFIHLLKRHTKDTSSNCDPAPPVYVVLDDAERLLKNFPHLIAPLLRIREFVPRVNLCWILISRVSWDKYIPVAHGVYPVMLHFPCYKPLELFDILKLDMKQPFADEEQAAAFTTFYHGFLSLVLRVFHPFCNQINELRKICSFLFPKYYDPVQQGKIPMSDAQALYKAIQPALKLGQLQFSQFVSQTKASEKLSNAGYTAQDQGCI